MAAASAVGTGSPEMRVRPVIQRSVFGNNALVTTAVQWCVCGVRAPLASTVVTLQPCLCLELWRPVSCDVCGASWLDACTAPWCGIAVGGLSSTVGLRWRASTSYGLCVTKRRFLCTYACGGFLLYFLLAYAFVFRLVVRSSICISNQQRLFVTHVSL